ncbi:MAG: TonB-dependent receptor [Tannerellaceae bacterium]|jgi:TonB-linked SusC/RagA family outer membrane protein|nr:TonB-dependent receptor [Tannerellaceae bacterium]
MNLQKTIKQIFICVLLIAGTSNSVVFSADFSVTGDTEKNVISQQTRKITGKVVDEKGIPLIGANVIEKGTTNGIVTDVDGNYSLSVGADATLQFSFIGYQTKELKVGNQTTWNITLVEDVKTLEDVVVVAYGTMKKESLTGAVSAIRNKDIITTKNESLVNMITGKIPGLQIKQNSAEPGVFNSNMQIRGMGNPLIIIDGVPRDNMAKLDGNDIETISVLKDGAAAIYGVRAANGVVLIKTKQGKAGEFKIDYSGSYGMQQLTKYPETLSGWEYMVLTNEHSRNKGGNVIFSEEDIMEYKTGKRPYTNWGKVHINDIAPHTQHSVSASGGSERIDYFTSVTYLNQNGHLKSGDLGYERFSVRANVGAKVAKNLKVDVLLNGMTDVKDQPNYDTYMLFQGAWMHIPTLPLYANNNPDYLQQVPGSMNPIAMSDKEISGYRKIHTNLFQGSLNLTYDVPFIKNLVAKASYNYDYYNEEQKAFKKKYTLYEHEPETDAYIGYDAFVPSVLARTFLYKTSSSLQLSLNYNTIIAKSHNINSLLLYEETNSALDNFNAQREYSIDAVDQLFAGNTLNQQATQNSGSLYQLANKSFVGRLNYDFLSRYLAEFSFRYDGSSKFAAGSQWGFFPSAQLGWRISEEKFFKQTQALLFVDNLKIRASYGRLGDDSASSYQYLTGYTYPSGGYVLGGNWTNAILSKGLANPNITWYIANIYNVGVDADLWNGWLGVQAEYFKRDREGLLATRNLVLPGTVGVGLSQENLESDQTSGYEFVLTHRNKINDFSYSISGNILYNRTKWIYRERAESGNSYRNWRDNTANRYNNIWWGYGAAGQFISMQDYWSSPIQDNRGNSIGRPGDYRYQDWNEDGMIDDNDVRPIANTGYPLYNYGIILTADYKGIDFNILFQGAKGMSTKYYEMLSNPLMWDRGGLSKFMDRWHMENITDDPQDPNTKWIPGKFPSMTTYAQSNNYDHTSEFDVQDASYIRLKSIEIGYTLPKSMLKGMGIQNARIYLNGYNLLTFTGLEYTDPELPGGFHDGYVYPYTITYNVGVNLQF